MVAKVSPVLVSVTDTDYKPGVLVGAQDVALGDESDATYAEQWSSIRGGTGFGPAIVAQFDPYGGGVASVALRMRFEIANELEAFGTSFFVAAYRTLDAEEIGLFHLPDAPLDLPSVPSTGVIYDITDWTFEQTSVLGVTLGQALISGLQLRIRRNEDSGLTDADWMIRVYELNLLAGSGINPLRRYPRTFLKHHPRPANRRYGRSY